MRRLGVVLGLAVLAVACGGSGGGGAGGTAPAKGGPTVAMMPKNKGNPYFVSCHKGGQEAADQLGVKLLWDGPTETDPAKQNEVVEAWITRGVDVIAVSVENKEAISTVLRKARAKGIKVVTWDADAEKDARDVFVDQATPQGIASVLLEHTSRLLGGKGSFAIITASLTAANQNEWIKNIREQMAAKYPDLKLVDIRPSDDDRKRAFDETQTLLKVHPEVKVIMAIASPGGAGRGGGGQAVRAHRREGHRPRAPQRVEAVPERRRARLRGPVEHDGPRISDRHRCQRARARNPEAGPGRPECGPPGVEGRGRRPYRARNAVHVHEGERGPVRLLIHPFRNG
jgi:ABC-type sugar transport system substrate-binding protein